MTILRLEVLAADGTLLDLIEYDNHPAGLRNIKKSLKGAKFRQADEIARTGKSQIHSFRKIGW